MDVREQTLLKEIKDLYGKLKDNINGEYRGGCKIGGPGFCYEIYVNDLLTKVQELYVTFHPDYLDESDFACLFHTIGKEVKYVEYLYNAAIKPNAAKKRERELCGAIEKANGQIKLDLCKLFQKINELQTNG